MKLRLLFKQYRWPFYLGGLLVMSVVAQGILVFVATRPDAPRPLPDYYQKSLAWDLDAAVLDASRQLGWAVQVLLPAGVPHEAGMPRPVDVVVVDRDGVGVRGLVGQLQAVRPADGRLNNLGPLTEIPHLPGTYRALLRLDQAGLWEVRVDARLGTQRFVHSQRVVLTADSTLVPDPGR